MRLLVSCADSGSLKEIICNAGTDTSKLTAPQPLHVGTFLSQGLNSAIDKIELVSEEYLLLARTNGSIELIKITRHPREKSQDDQKSVTGPEEVLPEFEVSNFERRSVMEALTDESRLEPLYANSKRRVKLRDGFVSLQRFPNSKNTFLAATKSGLIHVIELDLETEEITKRNTLEVRAPLEFAQLNDLGTGLFDGKYIVGYGGEENLVKLIAVDPDFSKFTQIWEAKNVKNDKLDLRVPVWPTGLKFIEKYNTKVPEEEKINFQFVTVTHWSHLGLYRTQHGRKPLQFRDLLPNREPLTLLELIGDNVTPLGNLDTSDFKNFALVTADTKHNVFKFKVDGQLSSKFGKGDITGASSFIGIQKQKYLLQGGLDRYARVFELSSSKTLAKVYVGSRVNFLKVVDEDEVIDKKETENSTEKRGLELEEDAEALWDQLDKSGGKSHKKHKHLK